MVGHCRDTWWLGTAGILDGWALQECLVVGHCRDILRLGTARILSGWDTLNRGAAAILCSCCWSLQGCCAVIGHCTDTLWLGTAGISCHRALQSGSARREGEDKIDF